jgi:UDP-2,4-diacetamido-2,4,6-trideoxy-beta-L-altropyranose hydrolase
MDKMENTISLRPAKPEDARLLFEWRNDPVTRQVSFSSDEIQWETHVVWFEKVLHNPSRKIYIGELMENKTPFGQVRFDFHSNESCEINIAVAPQWRGRGFGTILIREGINKIFQDFPGTRSILALIKPDNAASKKAFQKCGFQYVDTQTVKEGEIQAERWLLQIK